MGHQLKMYFKYVVQIILMYEAMKHGLHALFNANHEQMVRNCSKKRRKTNVMHKIHFPLKIEIKTTINFNEPTITKVSGYFKNVHFTHS